MPVVVDTLGSAEVGAWSGGINQAVDATMLPGNASPRGWNTALALSRTGFPLIQKRRGLSCMTTDPITDAQPILGQHDYVEISTGTRRHINTTATTIEVQSGGTFTPLVGALTSSALPSFATANSLAFIFNGVDAKKVRGTTVEGVGITRPTVGSLSGAAGGAGLHNGTYELRVAYKNENTGHLSSASDTASATVAVTNDEIDWSDIPVSADTQVTHVLLLLRNTATMAQFYVVDEVTNGTTTATTSVADENLIVVAPTLTSRNPPPSGVKYCTVYKGRLVVSDGEFIYWSPIDQPESFPPFNVDGVDSSGDVITGLLATQDELIVAKDDRTFVTNGDLGGDYAWRQVDANVGCTAHKTMVNAANGAYWWSRHGIVRYQGGVLDTIGMRTYGDPDDRVNAATIDVASAVVHDQRGTIYFSVPDLGQDRATFILPFNYILGVLESDRWDGMDCASLGMAVDASGILQPTLGSYSGQLFQLWSTNNDGVAAGTTTSGTPLFTMLDLTSGATSFSDLDATFDTAGGALTERKVAFLDEDGLVIHRARITSNTATTITFTPGFFPPATTYEIGGPDFEFDTPWRRFGSPWRKKRFEFLHLLTKGAGFGSGCTITMSFDYDEDNVEGKDRIFLVSETGSGAVFDEAQFDIDVFDSPQNKPFRRRAARTGSAWRARIVNARANQPFAMLLIAAQAVEETTKR